MDISKMITVVQIYIHIRTGKEIEVNTNNLNILLLSQMYNIASAWLEDQNASIQQI